MDRALLLWRLGGLAARPVRRLKPISQAASDSNERALGPL